MTQEQINEGNKLIAEFMGGKSRDQVQPIVKSHMQGDDIWLPIHGLRSPTELKYHTSWDWLMPVVGKISKFNIEPYKETSGWYSYYGLDSTLFCVDINLTFRHVAEFIKWYKEQS